MGVRLHVATPDAKPSSSQRRCAAGCEPQLGVNGGPFGAKRVHYVYRMLQLLGCCGHPDGGRRGWSVRSGGEARRTNAN